MTETDVNKQINELIDQLDKYKYEIQYSNDDKLIELFTKILKLEEDLNKLLGDDNKVNSETQPEQTKPDVTTQPKPTVITQDNIMIELQVGANCGMHAINNMFQKIVLVPFQKDKNSDQDDQKIQVSMDDVICKTYDPICIRDIENKITDTRVIKRVKEQFYAIDDLIMAISNYLTVNHIIDLGQPTDNNKTYMPNIGFEFYQQQLNQVELNTKIVEPFIEYLKKNSSDIYRVLINIGGGHWTAAIYDKQKSEIVYINSTIIVGEPVKTQNIKKFTGYTKFDDFSNYLKSIGVRGIFVYNNTPITESNQEQESNQQQQEQSNQQQQPKQEQQQPKPTHKIFNESEIFITSLKIISNKSFNELTDQDKELLRKWGELNEDEQKQYIEKEKKEDDDGGDMLA